MSRDEGVFLTLGRDLALSNWLRSTLMAARSLADLGDDSLEERHVALGFRVHGSGCGYAASAIDFPPVSKRCHSSSVMNGISGCSSRRAFS